MLSHFSRVRLSMTPGARACQPPLSMGFSRQEYWSMLPCPPSGDLPKPGNEPESPVSPALAGGFTARATWKPREWAIGREKSKVQPVQHIHLQRVLLFIILNNSNSVVKHFHFLCKSHYKGFPLVTLILFGSDFLSLLILSY